MLDTEELLELEDNLKTEFSNNLTFILTSLNRNEKLYEFLDLINLTNLIQSDSYLHHKNGKIVILGDSQIKQKDIYGIIREYNISKNRIEFNLDYYDAKNYDFRKLQYEPKYSLILVGPMPHSVNHRGDYNSIISKLENESGYPPVIRIEDKSSNLKFSKTSFKDALNEAFERKYIIEG